MRRVIERFLLLAGIAMLGVWAWSEVRYAVWQDWGNWAFERELGRQSTNTLDYLNAKKDQAWTRVRAWLGRTEVPSNDHEPVPVVPPPEIARTPGIEHNGLIGRLTIPRLHLTAAVREGAEEDTLAVALGHIPSTSLPGQKGNVGIAGHRDRIFRGLKEIRQDDLIRLETLSGNYSYQVTSTEVVKPSDVSVLKAANISELTLVTCFPFYYVGAAPDRFIVKARQLAGNPAPEAGAAALMATIHPDVSAEVPKVLPHRDHDGGRVGFEIPKDHSRQLAPGIWFGVTGTNVESHSVQGWMWLMPERKTIWLRDRSTEEPVVFYSARDGKRRELRVTKVMSGAVTGYLASSD
jgi:sortase A